MSEAEEKGDEKKDGFNASFAISGSASGSTILNGLKRCRVWIAKNFLFVLVPVAVGAGGGTGGFYLGQSTPHQAQAQTPASSTAPKPWVKFSSLIPGQTVARCTQLSGTAQLASGEQIWIFDESLGSDEYYLKGAATPTPIAGSNVVNWNYLATIGAAGKGGNFNIVAVVVDGATSDFLGKIVAAIDLKKVSGGLASGDLLTGLASQRVPVQRNADNSAACP